MRRVIVLILVVLALMVPVSAAEPGYVALTFDDGPSGEVTQELLAGLEERGVRATFFLCGYRLETYAELASEIRADGHELGLHGYSHDSMTQMTKGSLARELEDTEALLPDHYYVNLLRAPGGNVNAQVKEVARDRNLSIISWSVDPRDWATGDAALVEQRVLAQTRDGDIILLHDMTRSSVEAALNIVDELSSRGYQFLTVSQLAMLRLCQLTPGEEFRRFGR